MDRALSGVMMTIILIMFLISMSGTVAAQDEYPDQCNNAKKVTTGTYSGELSPKDADTLVLDRENSNSYYIQSNSESKLWYTFVNKRVIDALFDSDTKKEFLSEVNSPEDEDHLNQLDYTLTGGFSKHRGRDDQAYMWMGEDARFNTDILAFDAAKESKVGSSPLHGPIWIAESGEVSGALFFESDDSLCLRVQTPTQEDSGSWELTIQEEEPTSTETQDSEETQSGETEQTQQPETDDQAETGSETTQVDPSISFEPSEPKTEEQVAFSGSGTTISNGEITRYHWNFGNGETASGESVVHTYSESGGYNVELTVTTDQGNTHTTTQPISVEENEPDESDGGPISVETPGFGFGSIIISLGSLTYILKRKIN